MAKRARTERREAERVLEKAARAREKLASLEPGGGPDRPVDVVTASVIEAQARSAACLRCGAPSPRVAEHEARSVGDRRLRVVRVVCSQCGAERTLYFRIVAPN